MMDACRFKDPLLPLCVILVKGLRSPHVLVLGVSLVQLRLVVVHLLPEKVHLCCMQVIGDCKLGRR
jgi:hypothetical protein